MAKRQLKIRKMNVTNRRRVQGVAHQTMTTVLGGEISDNDSSPKPMLAEVIEINTHQRA